MLSNILKSFFSLIFVFVFAGLVSSLAGQAHAASNVSIRLEDPKSPTNQDNFNLVFVTLDILERPITVKCFKQGPTEGSFSQFGSNIAVSAGGNTGNCPVSSAIMNTGGTYQFYTTATAGVDSATSTIDSVDFNTSGPGTPTNFDKNRIGSCQYKISYRSADDSGKTVKVELYRSENQTFNADSGTRVDTHALGSNAIDSFTNSISDCNKSYFYVLRAFDSFGNGSGLVGDASVTIITSGSTTTTTTTITPTTLAVGGAIPVEPGQTQVTGEKEQPTTEVGSTTPTPEGEVKGIATKEGWFPRLLRTLADKSGMIIALVLLGAAASAYYFYNKSHKKK